MTVHNHGPSEGRGLGCPELMVGGKLRGACLGPVIGDGLLTDLEEVLEAHAWNTYYNACLCGWRARDEWGKWAEHRRHLATHLAEASRGSHE